MNDPRPTQPDDPQPQAEARPATCLRCGRPGPVGDDGFCAACEKAIEQACL